MIPVFRRFTQGDVPTAPNWINYIFNPLNTFCEQVVQALTKNLVIGENVQGMKYTFTFTTGVPSGGLGEGVFLPVKFQYTGGGKPSCLMLGQLTNNMGSVLLSSPIIEWNLDVNTNPYTINITNIHNLDQNIKYTATVVVL
jgi:hypothetical protein